MSSVHIADAEVDWFDRNRITDMLNLIRVFVASINAIGSTCVEKINKINETLQTLEHKLDYIECVIQSHQSK